MILGLLICEHAKFAHNCIHGQVRTIYLLLEIRIRILGVNLAL